MTEGLVATAAQHPKRSAFIVRAADADREGEGQKESQGTVSPMACGTWSWVLVS